MRFYINSRFVDLIQCNKECLRCDEKDSNAKSKFYEINYKIYRGLVSTENILTLFTKGCDILKCKTYENNDKLLDLSRV